MRNDSNFAQGEMSLNWSYKNVSYSSTGVCFSSLCSCVNNTLYNTYSQLNRLDNDDLNKNTVCQGYGV